jgi:tellurite resistance protein TehA-like permease
MRQRLTALAFRMARPAPASFAFVMATGIVAIAAHQHGLRWLARAGFVVNTLAWIALTISNLARLAWDRAGLARDFRSHARAPGFLTAVAGTSVLAGNVMLFDQGMSIAQALAAWAAVLWIVLTYGVLAALATREDKPPLDQGLNGSWLLAVVACQSIAVIAELLSAQLAQPLRLQLNFAALCLWLSGGMLYTWIIALIFYRYLFLRLAPADLTPAYWINMGAMAISTLAGSLLVTNAADAPFLHSLLPFIEGFTLLYWATATWWLPMLVALTFWRYAIRRDAFDRSTLDWSMVFPLGMYSAATHQMRNALGLEFLAPVASAFCWIAIAAWVATAATRFLRTD